MKRPRSDGRHTEDERLLSGRKSVRKKWCKDNRIGWTAAIDTAAAAAAGGDAVTLDQF